MTGDKCKFMIFNEINKEKNITFGNNSPAVIKEKCIFLQKDKVKAGNAFFVDGLINNLLSVIQMCNQWNEVVSILNNCVVRNLDTGKIVKGTRTPGNVYVLEGGQEHCYLRK